MFRRLTAVIEREGDGYVALCPELDIASQGDTIEDARANLTEALTLFFEAADPSEIDCQSHSEVFVDCRRGAHFAGLAGVRYQRPSTKAG